MERRWRLVRNECHLQEDLTSYSVYIRFVLGTIPLVDPLEYFTVIIDYSVIIKASMRIDKVVGRVTKS